jgi:pSer/pThr/pTyr-binding forkhead associated (FHA) protein
MQSRATPFLEACGGASLRVEVVAGGAPTGIVHDLDRPFAVVGRDADSDIRLDDPDVSRRHAYLQMVGGRVFCTDLRSRTGVHWTDGRRPWGWIDEGRPVRVGSLTFRPLGVTPAPEPGKGGEEFLPISRSFDRPALDAALEMLSPPSQPTSWRLSRVLVLAGCSRLCKVNLPGRGVAPVHFSLVSTPEGVWLVDLLGPRGIAVNGSAVRWARLADGDELRAGPYRLAFRCGTSAARLMSRRSLQSRTPGSNPPASAAPERATAPGLAARIESPPLDADLIREIYRGQQQIADQFQQALLLMFRMHQDQMGVLQGELERLRHQIANGGSGSRGLPLEPAAPAPAAGERPAGPVGGRAAAPPPAVDRPPPVGAVAPAPGCPVLDPAEFHARLSERLTNVREDQQGAWQKLLNALKGAGGEGPG